MYTDSIDNSVEEEVVVTDKSTKVIKPIKKRIRRNPDSKKRKMYFTSDTKDAIIAYQNSNIKKEKDKLYMEEIAPAFEKLVENLINIHKFTGLHDSYDDLKNDCVIFLFETISKFKANLGTNPFSYFNVVAKNWLIIKAKQRLINSKKNISIDNVFELENNEAQIIEEYYMLPSQDVFMDMEANSQELVENLYKIREKIETQNELVTINSIITVFENSKDIDILNKTAIMLYLKELSGLSSKQLTMTLQIIRKYYKELMYQKRRES